jgi:3D (Asp-Asp-Asp) domain-containing protein
VKSLAAGAPEGPVRHKFGRLAGVSDSRKQVRRLNALPFVPRTSQKLAGGGPHKVAEIAPLLCYGSALVGGPRTRSAARLAGTSAALVLAGVSAAAAASPVDSLQKQVSSLQARTHRALLDLYALDTRSQTAQTELTSLQAQADRLRTQQTLLRLQLSVTRHTLSVSQHELGLNLRMLYKQGDVSTLAVVLGAQNLDEAVTKLDALTSVASESRKVVETTSAAQSRLTRLRTLLAERNASIGAAVRAAQQTANALRSARAARLSFISQLRGTQRLKTAEINALQSVAKRVERKSDQIQATAVVAAESPVGVPVPLPVTQGRTLLVSSTGYSLPGRTATGIPVGWGVIAVDPAVIPLGTRLTIPGYGEGVAADTGSAVRGATIDLWFPSLGQARAWGRRTVTITLH